MSAATATLFDRDQVIEAIRLIVGEGVTELRALEATSRNDRYPCTISGYFDSADDLANALDSLTSAKGIYFTPNLVKPELLARASNRLRRTPKGESTSDNDIIRRRWLLIDCDANRASGISASDKEHDAALQKTQDIELFLHNQGWPDPIRADSGNGGHLLYQIDLPADDAGLVQRCLASLAHKFNDGDVKVDQSVFNPSRIWKLYGTVACKGDSTAERPHRMAAMVAPPDRLEVVSLELLEELAAMAPAPEPKHATNGKASTAGPSTFDISGFIQRNGLDVTGPDSWNGGRKWTFNTSLMCDHHGDGPFLAQFASGAITAGCHHDSCGWNWHDLRAFVEPKQERSSTKNNDDQPADRHRIDYRRITSSELAAGNYELEYLIDGALVAGQPLVIGGPQKTLKTGILIDAAIALASGGHFLGYLPVTRPCRVAVMTGESGLATIQETAIRICNAANLSLATLDNLIWSDDLPRFGDIDHLDAVDRFIEADGIEVLFIDPAYLSMPSADAGNIMAQGELLRGIAEICRNAGSMLCLAHHTKRHTGRDPFEPGELADLAWAGYAEFARQWWLVNRREKYEPGSGEHRLWFSMGGSAGHGGLWALNIDEGTRETADGRFWDVGVNSAADAAIDAEQRKEKAKREKTIKQTEADVEAVLKAVASLGSETKNEIKNATGLRTERFNLAFAVAVRDKLIESTQVAKGNNRQYDGYKLATEGDENAA